MYNRASLDLEASPWSSAKPVITWDPAAERWVGDVPDGASPPGKAYPFIMKPYGWAQLFGMGRADGLFPEHYEPWESPVTNPLSSVQSNPLLGVWEDQAGEREEYPILATTHRLVEQMHGGRLTRNLPWLVELMPRMFVELSEELAVERGIASGEGVVITSARGQIRATTIVTKRLHPLSIDGQVVHQVAMPWHWGHAGLSAGDSANLLTARLADGNTLVPEYRAFLVDIRKRGRPEAASVI